MYPSIDCDEIKWKSAEYKSRNDLVQYVGRLFDRITQLTCMSAILNGKYEYWLHFK